MGTTQDTKLSYRKLASTNNTTPSQAANASGGSGRPTTHAMVHSTQAPSQGTMTSTTRSGGRKNTILSTSGGNNGPTSSDSQKNTQHQHTSGSSVDHRHTHVPSTATHTSRAVPSLVSSNSTNAKTGSGSTGGAIRRLFTSTTANQEHAVVPSLLSTMTHPSQLKTSTTVVSSSNAGSRPATAHNITSTRTQTQSSNTGSSGSAGVSVNSGHSTRASGDVKSSQPVSIASRAYDGGSTSSSNTTGVRLGMKTQSGAVGGDSVNHKTAGGINLTGKGIQGGGTGGGYSLSMTYSSVINSAPAVETAPQLIHHHPRVTDVIEQPLQQIMKTPTIFQEPATQLAKPKKKSTYSDAVGKKPASTSGASSVSAVVGSGEGSTKIGGGIQPVVIPTPQAKLNLAPGSRLSGDKVGYIVLLVLSVCIVNVFQSECTYMYMNT